ncbi:hypothetical protein C8Q74DRAFT_869760 [Fomes fomentarius]|nr:hypothetical protein C8Q74DRAFT_869760 [Fomes fomentarius]
MVTLLPLLCHRTKTADALTGHKKQLSVPDCSPELHQHLALPFSTASRLSSAPTTRTCGDIVCCIGRRLSSSHLENNVFRAWSTSSFLSSHSKGPRSPPSPGVRTCRVSDSRTSANSLHSVIGHTCHMRFADSESRTATQKNARCSIRKRQHRRDLNTGGGSVTSEREMKGDRDTREQQGGGTQRSLCSYISCGPESASCLIWRTDQFAARVIGRPVRGADAMRLRNARRANSLWPDAQLVRARVGGDEVRGGDPGALRSTRLIPPGT